jgi:TRAP-type C4-dicarboxylate transport system substrate-binding protein
VKENGISKWSIPIKALIVLALLALLTIQAGCVGAVSAGSANKIELKLAHFFPSTHPAETQLVQGWAKAVSEATNGVVVITSYPGETLFKAGDIYDNVVEGAADIGLSCFSYNIGRFPEMEAFEQPGIVYKNSKVASKVAWEGVKELNPKCVQDTKLLMVIATGPGDLFTKTLVTKLEDIQGMQIRATGLTAETLKLAGAVPVGMPQSEAYEALQKGIVAGNLAPIEVLKSWKHGEVVDYLTRTPFLYNNLFYVTMNLDKWNSLPADIQKAITDTTEKFHEEVGIGLWDEQNETALEWAVNEEKMEITELSAEETARWIQAVEPMIDKYVSEKGEAGQKAIDTVKRLAEKYNKEY